MITGRKPVISKSRKDVASFKLRKNQPIGCRVTLRGDAMFEFLTVWLRTRCPAHPRLPRIVAAQVRQPWQLYVRHQRPVHFPGNRAGKIKRTQGMDITFMTTAPNDEQARDLMKFMGFPFSEK